MTRLPVVQGRGTSAASTAFCAVEVEVGPGLTLWLDGNGKITAGNGTLKDPKPNALSLPAGNSDERRAAGHCPGSTSICRASCYVHGLEKHASETYALYEHNAATLAKILATPKNCGEGEDLDALRMATADALGDWIAENAKGGFRWHVSGDVESMRHAFWITDVCASSPDVRHWIYTRSFRWVDVLVEAPNLTVNLSADADNYEDARWYAREYDLRLCYLSHDGYVPADLPTGSVIFPDYAFRGGVGTPWFDGLPAAQKKMVCPVDGLGKSEERRCGPCSKCIDPAEAP